MDLPVNTLVFVIVGFAILGAINIMMLIEFFRRLKLIRTYLGFGLGAAAIYLIFYIPVRIDAILNAATASSLFGNYATIINLTKLIGITALGIYYCRLQNMNSAPLIMKLLKFDRAPGERGGNSTLLVSSQIFVPPSFLRYNIHNLKLYKKPEMPDIKKLLSTVAVIAGAGIIFSLILFLITSPTVSKEYEYLSQFQLNDYTPSFFVTLLLVILVAFTEEIFFRLGIQNFLAVYFKLKDDRYWLAILITATVWTLMHWGTMDPGWVKMVQVFPVGLALGWTFKKYGVEACILIHAVFNMVLTILSPYLITVQ